MRISLTRNGLARLAAAAPLLLAISACDDGDSDNPRLDAGPGNDGGRSDGGRNDSGSSVDEDGGGNTEDPDGGGPVAPVMGDTYVLTSDNALLWIAGATGALETRVALTGIPDGEAALGIDVRPKDGVLYLLTDAKKLYTVDPQTGEASEVATLTADAADASEPFTELSGTRFGVDFNPVADRLRVVSDSGQNLRINVDTGATTSDGAINPAGQPVAAGYTNSFGAACRTQLFVVDGEAGTLSLQNPPNDGTLVAVGALGSVEGEVSAFDVATASDGTNAGYLVTSSAGAAWLYDLSLTTGAASNPRELTLDDDVTVLGFATTTGEAPAQARGELLGLNQDNELVSFNRAAPGKLCTRVAISGLEAGEDALGIDVRPADGALYALGSTGKLYTVNLDTAVATAKSTLSAAAADASNPFTTLDPEAFAIGFNPVPDRLRVITRSGQNLRIDVDTGAVTTDVALSPGGTEATALAYTNSFAGAKSTALYAIDTAADALVRVGSAPATGGTCDAPTPDSGNPNCGVVTSVGALGLSGDVTAVNGFDIDGKNGVALAALTLGAATSSTLYAIDLTSGAAALPAGTANGTIGGSPLRGLVFAANPTLTAYGLTSANALVVFAVSTPGTLVSSAPITGLQGGENILGIDVRSADGRLYAAGSSGRLYTLNSQSGAATEVVTLKAATGDDAPFTAFGAGPFGVDFNPVADLLRVVDSDGQNLRIAPSARAAILAGDVFTDAVLNPGTPRITAAAYTNAYAGTTSTSLYTIDSDTNQLYLQGGLNSMPSPNTGVLTAVGGGLSVDASGDVGFDIAGGHNGLAALAITPAGSTQSQLYSVSLASGVASPFLATGSNTIGDANTPSLRGIALDLK